MGKRLTDLVGLNRYLWTKSQIAERLAYIREQAETELQEMLAVNPYYDERRYCDDLEQYIATLTDIGRLLGLSLEQEAEVIGEHGWAVIWGAEDGQYPVTPERIAEQRRHSAWLRAEFDAHQQRKAQTAETRPSTELAFAG